MAMNETNLSNDAFAATRRKAAEMSALIWIAVTAGVLSFCTWTIDTDSVFQKAYDLDMNTDMPIHECMMTLMIMSIGWLALALLRGVRLKKEIGFRRSAEAQALALAREDALTGLLNRRAFLEEIEGAIAKRDRFTVLLIDLDKFKRINDALGHSAGDAALQCAARRLLAALGPADVAARLGGDEFAALVRADDPSRAPRKVADAVTADLQPPASWRGTMLRTGASIGAATFPTDAGSADALMHSADLAMYCAKADGGGKLRFFEPTMVAERSERQSREEELRRSISRGDIRPYYQPIVRLADEAVCGFEVLARWLHPRLGLLPPSEFIALAEETGQITMMTECLLRQACRDLGPLPAPVRFAINISPTQLAEPGLAERLIAIVRAEGVSPDRVEIELTEDAIMGERAATAIASFRASGMTIALDDFGTGFSGLSTLRSLKFDKLKIDRSFVGSMLESDESRKLVEAILELGRSFGLEVTAEGIESRGLVGVLAAKGCAQGQGYLFGKPMPIDAAVELVQLRRRPAA